MLELVRAGGWLMLPIIFCSVLAAGVIIERMWFLQAKRVIPEHLVARVWHWLKNDELDEEHVWAIRNSSPMGRVLAAGLAHRLSPRDIMKEAVGAGTTATGDRDDRRG